ELLGDVDLVVIEQLVELLPLFARLLEERSAALDGRFVGAGEDPEVGARLGELRLELLLRLHRGERDREQRALRGGDRAIELRLLLRTQLEARLELVEARLQERGRRSEGDGQEDRQDKWGQTPISII